MLVLFFSSKLNWHSYIFSTAKSASKTIGTLIHSMNFLSPKTVLYLYNSIIWPGMKYCCHVWAYASNYYLDMLDKLQKRVCKTVDLSHAVSLESLAHRRNGASLSLF